MYQSKQNHSTSLQQPAESAKDSNSNTRLIFAAKHRGYECIEQLVNAGAALNIPDNNGNTPLHFLAERRNVKKAIELLIDKGADIQLTNHAGETALDIARKHNRHTNALSLQLAQKGVSGPVKFDNTPPLDAIRPIPIRPTPQRLMPFREAFAYEWRQRVAQSSSQAPVPGTHKRKQPEQTAEATQLDTPSSWTERIANVRASKISKGI